jgi:ribosomal protein S18 acetylase RimI-like enzyme
VTLTIRLLGPDDGPVLDRVAPDVFDGPVDPYWTAEFLADPRHHIAVALDGDDGDLVVGMASGVHYVHPDKPPQMFINEVGVAPSHHRQGIGRRVVEALLERARERGCTEAWVLTAEGNAPAQNLYASSGGIAPERSLMYTFPLD